MNEDKARYRQDSSGQGRGPSRNELFIEAFEHLDEQFIEARKTSGVDDVERREKIFHLSQALLAVKGIFRQSPMMVNWLRPSLTSSRRHGRVN